MCLVFFLFFIFGNPGTIEIVLSYFNDFIRIINIVYCEMVQLSAFLVMVDLF